MTTPQILDLRETDEGLIEEVAQFFLECFQQYAPGEWPDLESCRVEIRESFEQYRTSRVMVSEAGHAIGWIGAMNDQPTWEIHPLAVSPLEQRKGYGKLLVEDMIEVARSEGAVAIMAGTSDATKSTSLSEVDLYRNPSAALEEFFAEPDHPVQFWRKMGFHVVGVVPDGDGLGKPWIHFAKRLI